MLLTIISEHIYLHTYHGGELAQLSGGGRDFTYSTQLSSFAISYLIHLMIVSLTVQNSIVYT